MHGVLLAGLRYCANRCLEQAVFDAFERVQTSLIGKMIPHRVPLGLLLLSREQLTVEQLRTALAAQRSAGHGRLGEWLVSLGFVTEEKITAALARQWSCPVLRSSQRIVRASRCPQIPVTLLEHFAIMPVDYVAASSTLHVAFSDGIDHGLLYAIERMTGSRVLACLAQASFVRETLRNLLRQRSEYEVAFEGPADTAECSRIVRSYSVRLSATEVRLAGCGPFVWVRLFRPVRPPMDLLFHTHNAGSSISDMPIRSSSDGKTPLAPH